MQNEERAEMARLFCFACLQNLDYQELVVKTVVCGPDFL